MWSILEKNPQVQNYFIICAANSIRTAMDAGNFDTSWRYCLQGIPEFQSDPLIILLLQAEKEIRVLLKNRMFKF
jgi:hypothetical protein